jgi:hypothetical protein
MPPSLIPSRSERPYRGSGLVQWPNSDETGRHWCSAVRYLVPLLQTHQRLLLLAENSA